MSEDFADLEEIFNTASYTEISKTEMKSNENDLLDIFTSAATGSGTNDINEGICLEK